MTSGKRAKQERRGGGKTPPPPVRSTGRGPGARRANPKILGALAGAVVIAVVAIVLAVTLTGGGDSKSSNVPETGSLPGLVSNATYVDKLFRGIPQSGRVLGKANAPVTLVEYVDLQCPYCRQYVSEVIPELLTEYVRPGKLRIEARPIAFIGPDSFRGRDAALAAARQDLMFNFVDLLYVNQGTENTGWLSDGTIEDTAASIPGMNVPQLLKERKDVEAEVKAVDAHAASDAVDSTPTVLVGKTGGKLARVDTNDATDPAPTIAAIEAALK